MARKREKRERIVPYEKSRKVIKLEKRGRDALKVTAWHIVFCIVGLLSLMYFIAMLFVPHGTNFFYIWAFLGIFNLGIGAALYNRRLQDKLSRWLRAVIATLFLIAFFVITVLEGLIIARFREEPEPGADYMIILGAQWKATGPSVVLQQRLDAALTYLENNPETVVIVSGGKGGNEPVSEAEGMKQYLISADIEEDRILLEDKSTNTTQNLLYSGEMIDKDNGRVIVVSNNFHIYRATRIAAKQGYKKVEGLAAISTYYLLPNNIFREVFGVVKDFILGNLNLF